MIPIVKKYEARYECSFPKKHSLEWFQTFVYYDRETEKMQSGFWGHFAAAIYFEQKRIVVSQRSCGVLKFRRGFDVIPINCLDGSQLFAKLLGFSSNYEMIRWFGRHPQYWGNTDFMWIDESNSAWMDETNAGTFPREEITLAEQIEFLTRFKQRLQEVDK